MSTPVPLKKAATSSGDWHRADIKAALEKAGWTLRRLCKAHGYADCGLKLCFIYPWPKAQTIIARAIGTTPQTIWPTRYHADGTPKKGLSSRRQRSKNTTSKKGKAA